MQLKFSKMHGLGNDFMVVDLVSQHWETDPKSIAAWGDRHTGVGFDQFLAVKPPTDPDADFYYQIFNSDGSEAEQCGNGARCFARFVADQALSPKTELVLQTSNNQIKTVRLPDGRVEVDMGVPRLEPDSLPFVADNAGFLHQITVADEDFKIVTVSVGNPHAVLFVDDVMAAPVARIGAALTKHERFPEGVNVGFCEVVDRHFARLRVFERGVGETRACGTGACAAMIAANLTERLDARAKVSLPGGKLKLSWPGPGELIKMTGPAALIYEGQVSV